MSVYTVPNCKNLEICVNNSTSMESPLPLVVRKMGKHFYWASEVCNFHLPLGDLSQMEGLKFFTLIIFFLGGRGAGDKGQSLLKLVCLFQVKLNFSIENIFFQSSVMKLKIS